METLSHQLCLDYAALEKAKESMDGYNFHFLEPPQPMVFGSTLPSKEFSRKLDYISFVKKAVEYVHHNNISSIVFSIDSMAMIGAAVCQETGLPGPTFESEFLCLHKYYSRKTEPSNLWCECVFLSRPVDMGPESTTPCTHVNWFCPSEQQSELYSSREVNGNL